MERATQRSGYLRLASPDIGDAELGEIAEAVRSGWVTTGPRVERLERRLEGYLRAPHVRCTASCTAAMQLALRMAGIGRGDEVLVPAMTFVSCANVVEHAGARPVLVDCDPATGHIDLAHGASLVTDRTAAILPVHLAGHPLDMDAVNAFRDRFGLAVVEDAAHAIGAAWKGQPIGSHGNPAAFSFHATKNMTTFEGGALTLFELPDYERAQRLSLHGLSRNAWSRHDTPTPADYEVHEPGFKSAMHDVAAAVGLHQLAALGGRIERRRALAGGYDELLADTALELPPAVPDHARHAHHLYLVRVPGDAAATRDEVAAELHAARIQTSVHFKAIHLHAYYRERYGYRPQDLPVSADRSARVLTLPLHPGMTESDVEEVSAVLAGALR
jgi:dTDP-4-amino-4,6-dideoxygalactose transaminase